MSTRATTPKVLAIGRVDARGVRGTQGAGATWEELGVEAPGNGRAYRALTGRSDPTFRRLDRQTKAIVLATAVSGVDALLGEDEREHAALVTESVRGSLEVDLRYVDALERGIVHAAIFPYTLPSTCLGDVALRHGLRGPTYCLSVDPDGGGVALAEARRLLEHGGARHAVVGVVEALAADHVLAPAALCATVAVVAAADEPGEALVPWREGPGAFAGLAERCG